MRRSKIFVWEAEDRSCGLEGRGPVMRSGVGAPHIVVVALKYCGSYTKKHIVVVRLQALGSAIKVFTLITFFRVHSLRLMY